jgi:hypothetical protein
VAVTVKVLGTGELDEKAAALRREAARFQRRVSTAAGRAVNRVYRPTLIGMAPTFMPSGYVNDLVNDLRVRTSVRFAGSSPGVGVVVSAPTGGPKGRAVNALEAGILRHPLFGNKLHWYAQRVGRGFVSIPLRAVQPQISRELDLELSAVKRDVEGA